MQRLLVDREEGKPGLPDSQRGWRWTSTRVRDYIDSLYKGYPSGILLLWEPLAGQEIDLRGFKADGVSVDHPRIALWKVKRGDLRLRFQPLKGEFQVENAANRRSHEWLAVHEVLDWTAAQVNREARQRFGEGELDRVVDAVSQLQRVLNYPYRVCTLKTEDYTMVVESFVRLNGGGVPLKQAELAMADLLLGVRGFYAQEVSSFITELEEEHDSDCDITFLMRCFNAVLTHQGRLIVLRRELQQKGEGEVREAWEGMKRGLLLVVAELLGDGLSRRQLPSVNPLVPLVYYRAYLASIPAQEQRLLRGWFYLASARARYSGAVETTLTEDLQGLAKGGPQQLAEELLQLPGGASVLPTELQGPYYRHPYLLLMYAVVRDRGGRDLFAGLPLSHLRLTQPYLSYTTSFPGHSYEKA